MVRFAESGPAVALPVPIVQLPIQVHRRADETDGLFVVAETGMAPPDTLQRGCLPLSVSDGAIQFERLKVVFDGLVVMPLPAEDGAEVAVDVGLLARVAQLGEQFPGSLQVSEGFVLIAQEMAGPGETAMCPGLRGHVTEVLGGPERTAHCRGPVVPVSLPL